MHRYDQNKRVHRLCSQAERHYHANDFVGPTFPVGLEDPQSIWPLESFHSDGQALMTVSTCSPWHYQTIQLQGFPCSDR